MVLIITNINHSIQHYTFILHTIKWFLVLQCITNTLIKYQTFVYIQLNDQTVLFQTIKHLFVNCLNVKQFYLAHR